MIGLGAVVGARRCSGGELGGDRAALERIATGDDDRGRGLREAKLAARVEHERVARVYDAGRHAGLGFVAMEYVQGTTLRG